MFTLLKNAQCYVPEYQDKKDILIVYDKILKISENIPADNLWDMEVIDCSEKIICPGLIDQHVHITGGGGEEGPISRIPEIMLSEIATAGVTTLVGVLGVDNITRSIAGLLAKAQALDQEGITTYIYTGSYSVPTATMTGKVMTDIAIIDKVIGVGEIAISDHRSSHPSLDSLRELVNEARVGGLIGGKAGIVHIHVGDGKEGLGSLFKLLDESDFPIEMFVPTHVNRNKTLFEQAVNYAKGGGYIDLTAGEKSEKGYSVMDALEIIFKSGANIGNITVSSDGNGSMPLEGGQSGVGTVVQLFEDIRASILQKKLNIEQVLKTVTSNVAKILKIYPKKGALKVGSDADVLILNKDDLSIDSLIARGNFIIKNKNVIKRGKYEK
ncbi:MAG: beta-aspartyl-peptidase [Clostridia bacterium]|nr:beta-aspartyl-peptidase [Clostridia bacterium]